MIWYEIFDINSHYDVKLTIYAGLFVELATGQMLKSVSSRKDS